MGNKKREESLCCNYFRQAVESTADIAGGFRNGLQALGKNSEKVSADDTKKLSGSVDIDACTRDLYPEDSRWDYAIGYENLSYFVEVHPANTSNVREMIKKANWLRRWLDEKASALKSISGDSVFYWIPSGKCAIAPGSPQSRMLAGSKIRIVSPLRFPLQK